MKRFKHFVKLHEELTDDQRRTYNNPKKFPRDSRALAATDHFFGVGNDVISKPLEGTMDKSEVHRAVERHLNQEISHDDYKQGVVSDRYNRKVRIGSMLAKSKAPSNLINSFANDNTRQGKKYSGLTVVTTRSPGGDPSKGDLSGVAGQTSSKQSWEQLSCKNVTDGSNRHYLGHEIEHGTVVTYLKDHEGREIARATLQPHINDSGGRAYAVDSYYGIDHAGFKSHAQQLANELSEPRKEASTPFHRKHHLVYDDNGRYNILHPSTSSEEMMNILSGDSMTNRDIVAKHPLATPEVLNRALDKDQRYTTHLAAIQNKNASPENIDKALSINDKISDVNTRQAAIKHPNATKENIDKALTDDYSEVREQAIQHPNATKEHVEKALKDPDRYVRFAAIRHPNAVDHIDKALENSDEYHRHGAILNPNARKEHIDKALEDENSIVRAEAARHRNSKKEHVDKALMDKSDIVRGQAILSPAAREEHINKALDDSNEEVRLIAAEHSRATEGIIHKALDDPSMSVRLKAIQNQNATEKNINKALDDFQEPYGQEVRWKAMFHPNVTPNNIDKALDDPNSNVRARAIQHPNASEDNIHKALDDREEAVRLRAVRHPNATRKNIDKALDNSSQNVREAGMIALNKLVKKR